MMTISIIFGSVNHTDDNISRSNDTFGYDAFRNELDEFLDLSRFGRFRDRDRDRDRNLLLAEVRDCTISGPRNPVVVCFTSPLSSLTVI